MQRRDSSWQETQNGWHFGEEIGNEYANDLPNDSATFDKHNHNTRTYISSVD